MTLLKRRGNAMSRAMERLSTGLRINSAADDPSGLGMANNFKANIGRQQAGIFNGQLALSMLRTAEGGMLEIMDLLHRGRDIAVHAANYAVNSTQDLQAMQAEIDGILESIDSLTALTTFNGFELLTGGIGDTKTLTTLAEWENGAAYAPAGTIDTITSPGDVKLAMVPWADNSGVHHTAASGAESYNTIYISNVVDNLDGTTSARVSIEFNATANTTYNGSIAFDPGVVFGAVSGVGTAGNTATFSQATGPGPGIKTVWMDITAPTDSGWTYSLGSGAYNTLYYGNNPLYSKLPAWSYSDYFTTINPAGQYTSGTIDMDSAGGTASFTWDADAPGGTSLTLKLQESATGAGGWSDLPLISNGEAFDYTQRYLRVVADFTSAGMTFGSPALHSVDIQKSKPIIAHIGPDTGLYDEYSISAMDARSTALGANGISVLSNLSTVLQLDTASEWQGGIVNLVNIDYLSDPGYVQLESPISNNGPVGGAANNPWVVFDYQANALSDGTYNITVNLNTYGNDPAGADTGLAYIGNIRFIDGEGNTVGISSVTEISYEGGAGAWSDSKVLNGPVGAYTSMDFNHHTAGATDGLTFNMVADPDVRVVMDFEVRGVNGGLPAPYESANYWPVDVYWGSTLVGDDVGSGVGSFHFERRLGEFQSPGSFQTNPVAFTSDTNGFVQGVANGAADPVQVMIEESTDGIGGWATILNYGGGAAFTTSATGNYIRMTTQVTGSAAAFNPSPYSYTQSGSPRIDSISITRENDPIRVFNDAINTLSAKLADVGQHINAMEREIGSRQNEILYKTSMLSRVQDADFAQEISGLARDSILRDGGVFALKAAGNLHAQRVSTLLQGI